jgi:hypothetical protein
MPKCSASPPTYGSRERAWRSRLLRILCPVIVAGSLASAYGDVAEDLTLARALELGSGQPSVTSARLALEAAWLDLGVIGGVLHGDLFASTAASRAVHGDYQTVQVTATAGIDAQFAILPIGPHADAIRQARHAVRRAELDLDASLWDAALVVTQLYHHALEAHRAHAEAVSSVDAAGARTARHAVLASLAQLSQTLGVEVTGLAGDDLRQDPLDRRAGTDCASTPGPDGTVANDRWALDVADAEMAVAAARREASPTAAAFVTYAASDGVIALQLGAGFDSRTMQPSLTARITAATSSRRDFTGHVDIGVSLSLPLGGGRDSRVRRSEMALDQARMLRDTASEAARLRVSALHRSVCSALERVDEVGRSVRVASHALALAHDGGLPDATRVVTLGHERALLVLRNAYHRAWDEAVLAEMALAAALGWEAPGLVRAE